MKKKVENRKMENEQIKIDKKKDNVKCMERRQIGLNWLKDLKEEETEEEKRRRRRRRGNKILSNLIYFNSALID